MRFKIPCLLAFSCLLALNADVRSAVAEESLEVTVTENVAVEAATEAGALEEPAAPVMQPSASAGTHAVSLHGTPKYAADFKHVDYVNPDAPKGGTLRLHSIGTFDSLNPFIVKGVPASGLNFLRSGFVFESLMQNAWDEPFSIYGVIAKDITIADDKSWVKFTLRDEAKWHDGKPITAEDVKWTFETLKEHGQPFYDAYWHDVKSITIHNPKSITFDFSVSGNAELPMIIAEMTVLPKHYWTEEGRNFSETTLDAPLGSGPYKIGKVDAGRSIEYVRNADWWGRDLPLFKGMYNFDRIIYDYYRDTNVAHEAFLSNDYDLKLENTAKTWQEGYKASSLYLQYPPPCFSR